MTGQILIYDLNLSELEDQFSFWNEQPYRAQQVWHGLYQNLFNSPKDFTTLPINLREKLGLKFSFGGLEPLSTIHSLDSKTQKTLFKLSDGLAIETVLMHYKRRRTLCISTQAGCAMGCVFCATGQMGFKRNLTSGEIVEQVLYFARKLNSIGERLSNIVVMGMGEPFHNYEQTMQAIDRLGHSDGCNFGARRFTISTVGLIPAIEKFTAENRQVNLAVSLHASEDKLRSSLLPINKKYPIAELMDTCAHYVNVTNRRITFEWALISNVNDSKDQARELVHLLRPFQKGNTSLCHVNVIPLNPTDQFNGASTTHERAVEFKLVLEKNGIPCTIRLRRGIDINAGCGQLAYEKRVE